MAKKIFVDTNPIIYLVGEEQPYYEKVLAYLSDGIRANAEFYTSTVTDAEFLVKPFADNDLEKIERYHSYLQRMKFLKCFVTNQIAETTVRLRAPACRKHRLRLRRILHQRQTLKAGHGS